MAKGRLWQQQEELVHIQSEIASTKQMTPARAFTTSMAQIFEQVSGRKSIQDKQRMADKYVSQANSALAGEAKVRQDLARDLLRKRQLTRLSSQPGGLDTKGQEELDKLTRETAELGSPTGEGRSRSRVRQAAVTSRSRIDKARGAQEDILGPGDVAKNLAFGLVGLLGATIAMKTAFTVLNGAVDTGGKAVADFAEMQLGYVNKASALGKTLGEAVIQQNGNTQAVIANTMAMSGMNKETAKAISPALASRAETIAGNDASQQRIEAMAAATRFGKNRPPGLPEGFDTNLVKSVGGFMDLGFGPGATAPIAEQLQNYIGQQFAKPVDGTPAGTVNGTGVDSGQSGLNKTLTSGQIGLNKTSISGLAGMLNGAGTTAGVAQTKDDYAARVKTGLAYMNDQAKAAGNSLKVVAEGGKDYQKQVEATVAALKGIGADQLASEFEKQNLAMPGLDQKDQRRAEFQTAQWLKDQNQYVQSPQELLKEGERARGAQIRSFEREQVRGVEQEIPAAVAMKFLARPMTPYGAKTLPQGGPAGNVPTVAKSGPFADQGGDVAGQYEDAYKKYAKPALAAQKMVTAEIDKGKQVLLDYGVPPDLISGISALGEQIQKVQKGIEQKSLNLTVAEYNNQIRVSNRSLRDARDLAAGIAGSTKDTLGGMQGQNIALGRQLQLLGFEMQQRQINFKLATAGFVAPGTTPEERAARIKAAEKEAQIAQKMLDLQKKMGSNQIKVTTIEAGRSVTDLTAQLSLLTQGKSLAIDTKASQDAIQAMNDQQEILIENANTYIKKGQKTVSLIDASITEIEARTGVVFTKWSNQLAASFKAAGVAYAEAIIYTMDPSHYKSKNSPKNGQAGTSRASAPGFVGSVSTPTQMTLGEAGSETVAILRNPRSMMVGGGGGGGGGSMTFNINISGGSDIDKKKFDALAREIASQVEGRMMQKTNLFALRRAN
jgi:hypothetical protein